MASAAISWYGLSKPFFVNRNGIRVNKENYCRHLRKELFPAIEKLNICSRWSAISLIPVGTRFS